MDPSEQEEMGGFTDIVDEAIPGMNTWADEEEQDFILEATGTEEEQRFDQLVGCLEDIILEDGFHEAMTSFQRENSEPFVDTEENKLEYTSIFAKYQEVIEVYIERRLRERGFSMEELVSLLHTKHAENDELSHDVFDVLSSLSDFATFKEGMLAFKKKTRELELAGHSVTVHREEMEDGEERPDIMLHVSPLSPTARTTK